MWTVREECGQGHETPHSLSGGLLPRLLPRGAGMSAVCGEYLLGIRWRAKHISPSRHPHGIDVPSVLFISAFAFRKWQGWGFSPGRYDSRAQVLATVLYQQERQMASHCSGRAEAYPSSLISLPSLFTSFPPSFPFGQSLLSLSQPSLLPLVPTPIPLHLVSSANFGAPARGCTEQLPFP